MKINIAIYTAQEGYSWQPGTHLVSAELKTYKECIGKFPSADSSDFPFGGIFLKDDKVVFYRYHIAAKFDFRGRNALYCVLGVLPKEDAAKVDPLTLFALPQFAAPMKPFPTEADIKESDPMLVPQWLRNLNGKTLDVRIASALQKIADWNVQYKDIPQPTPSPTQVEPPTVTVQSAPAVPDTNEQTKENESKEPIKPIELKPPLPQPIKQAIPNKRPHKFIKFLAIVALVEFLIILGLLAFIFLSGMTKNSN